MRRILVLIQTLCMFMIVCHAQFLIDYDSPESLYKQGMTKYNSAKYDDAFVFFAKSHNAGNLEASYMVGECFFQGLGTEEDKKKAFDIWLNAAERGNTNCSWRIGQLYLDGVNSGNLVINKDERRGFEWTKQSAEKNNADAQWCLGDLYYLGIGVQSDLTEAFKWYKKSSERLNPIGIWRVGVRLMDGDGTDKNLDESEKYLLQARRFGLKDVDFSLGKLYYFKKDYNKAIDIFAKIYEDDYEAARWLGSCYAAKASFDDSSTFSDALKYWEIAADKEELLGMFYTSLCYYSGLGCTQDYNRAVDLFIKIIISTGGTVSMDSEYIFVYGTVAKFFSTCLRYGRGIDPDIEEANSLLQIAEKTGYQDITIREVMENIKRKR